MLKEETTDGGDNSWAPRVCHTCRSAAGMVYCHQNSGYLCTSCTASRNERVWVCESCQRAPAEFLCKADAASLCSTCDAEIHSANPLARRHERVPIQMPMGSLCDPTVKNQGDEEDEGEAASWLLFNLGKDDEDDNNKSNNQNNWFAFSGDADEYLDLVGSNFGVESQFPDQYSQNQQDYSVPEKSSGSDNVVPCHIRESRGHLQLENFNMGVVPETTRPSMGTIEPFPGQVLTQLTPMEREARVERYREKKKTRRFEKTIRYASRKAYAETRPRIKGRFAKRADAEAQMDQVFSTSLLSETGYGIVPSF